MRRKNEHTITEDSSLYGSLLRDAEKLGFTRKADLTPDELLETAAAYCDWAESEPLQVAKPMRNGEVVIYYRPRALTLSGFLLFAGLTQAQYNQYAKDPDYMAVVEWIRRAFYIMKLENAAAGTLSESIISREIGLVERTQSTETTYTAEEETEVERHVRELGAPTLLRLTTIPEAKDEE